MKTIMALLILASTFSMVACHKEAEENMLKFISLVEEFHSTGDFLTNLGISPQDNTNLIGVVDYHPKSGDSRVVIRTGWTDGDGGEVRFFGVDMAGFHDVLKDIKNLPTELEKQEALEDLFEAGFVDELDKVYDGNSWNYFENGSGNEFSLSSSSSKDLESMGAKIENMSAMDLSENLVADYGLSEDRAYKVARTINAYHRITSKRSLTRREQNSYSQELLGVDYKKAEKAIMQGDDFDQLMEDAALKNGTSPEQVSAIIRDMIL